MPSKKSPPAQVIKADKGLQEKAGIGDIDQKKVQHAQRSMENTSVDFYAMAKECLDDLKKSIDAVNSNSLSKEDLLKKVSAPLLQLKSSAPLFEFHLVGALASIMFNFVQRIDHVDDKAAEIIAAHHTTLYAIISNKMVGDGGAQGLQLKKELEEVCKKYFSSPA